MITLQGVSKKYSITGKEVLDDIHLEIPRGQIIGLFGENGAGKTTLMKCILQLHSYQGSILLDENNINYTNIERLSFGTSEHSFFSEITAKEHREFYQINFASFKEKRFDLLMEFFELPINKKIKHFSTGQKNQFEVILALSQGAQYILLDEPFAGNDVFNREDFYKVLLGVLDENETILLSTHLIEEVENFIDRAIIIHQGTIVADNTMEQLQEEKKTLLTYVKEVSNYQKDRITQVITKLEED